MPHFSKHGAEQFVGGLISTSCHLDASGSDSNRSHKRPQCNKAVVPRFESHRFSRAKSAAAVSIKIEKSPRP
jgi:hypothetical protein